MIGLMIVIAVIIYATKIYIDKQRRIRNFQMPADTRNLLLTNVPFYHNLSDENKIIFENRIKDFLQHVRITGVGSVVEDIDRILIASGAIIPIFAFPGWRYNNINEVLLYKDAFNLEYDTIGNDINILGLVGDGALHRQMILSQASVRSSFQNAADGHNVVIHEFAHLIDKADGATDGIPEYLLRRPYMLPWINKMHETISKMKNNESADINIYGATNNAEFFAVVSEYFFERPAQLREHHPELYQLLERMFMPETKN